MARKRSLDELLAGNVEADRANFRGFAPVAEPGDDLRWIEVDLLEDNPWQPRTSYAPEDQLGLVEVMNLDGQLQPAGARPHPQKDGRYQLIWGHRRKYAVKDGAPLTDSLTGTTSTVHANAGARQPEPHKFIGKLLVIVKGRKVSDLEMMRQAHSENSSRVEIGAMDLARFYRGMKEALTKAWREDGTIGAEREVSIRALCEYLGERNHSHVHRLLQLLEPDALAPKILEALETERIGERHGRALLDLRNDRRRQLSVFDQIIAHNMTGAETERAVAEWLRKDPSLTQLEFGEVVEELRAEQAAAKVRGRNRGGTGLHAGEVEPPVASASVPVSPVASASVPVSPVASASVPVSPVPSPSVPVFIGQKILIRNHGDTSDPGGDGAPHPTEPGPAARDLMNAGTEADATGEAAAQRVPGAGEIPNALRDPLLRLIRPSTAVLSDAEAELRAVALVGELTPGYAHEIELELVMLERLLSQIREVLRETVDASQ